MSAKVIALAASATAAATIEPTRWSLLGHSVDAGSLCAGLICCAAVRVWSAGKAKQHQWTIVVPVSVVTFVFTIVVMLAIQPLPIMGALIGTGMAGVGEGIIRKAMSWADRWLGTETGIPGQETIR